jgi:hypothetical protein
MKQISFTVYGLLALFVFWGAHAFAQGKDDPAQLQAQIDRLTKEQMNIALSIQQASPDIEPGSGPQTISRLANAALQADFKENEALLPAVTSKCNGKVSAEEYDAAQSACEAVRIPYNKRLDELKARAQQLTHLDEYSDQIRGLREQLAGIRGLQCSCGTDEVCWTSCFDGSRPHDSPVTVAVGTPAFSTQGKAERDRKAIQEYLKSGSIPRTRVKVWSKPPPEPGR